MRIATRIVGVQLLHHFKRAPDDAIDAGVADEHVVRLFGQHELAGARQRIEARLGQRLELKLAVAIGEVGEHEEAEPVANGLVERAQDARLVGVAGVALQQLFRLLAAVAAEIGVQQVHHRPQMAAFFDVHLKQIAQVVQRGRGVAQHALLLDRGRLGVALGDDQPPQRGAIFAGNLLPHFLPEAVAEADPAVRDRARPERCPSDIPACARSRTSPSPWRPPRSRCADTRRPPGNRAGRVPATSSRNSGCQCSSARCRVRLSRDRRCSECGPDN